MYDSDQTGAQTLLYSIQKTLDKNIRYPPELVVLVTPDVSQKTRQSLCPPFCTRILPVEHIALSSSSSSKGGINQKIAGYQTTTPWDQDCPRLTKLHVFSMVVYDTILFLEPDCLVLQNLYPLLQRGKVYTESEALVAAAPDVWLPDKFNSGVMIVRPHLATFDNMMAQRSLLRNPTGDDTGFLNAYYSEWYTEMAPLARLPITYNAQRAIYDNTYSQGYSQYWELAIAPDLKVIHYSGPIKPWQPTQQQDGKLVASNNNDADNNNNPSTAAKPSRAAGDDLTDLWRQWHQRSKHFLNRYNKDKDKEKAWKEAALIRQKQQEQQQQPNNSKQMHDLVSKRFKELRKQGCNVKDAMAMARAEHGLNDEQLQPASVGAKVASMFGVMM
jgi:lipopolysaccharide biosynthesis glycosyltransferase